MYDIFFDLNNMHQTADDDEETQQWFTGDGFDFEFVKQLGEKIEEMKKKSACKKKSDGATCKSCGEFYPYADPAPDTTFKCWGCRNF